MKNYLDPGLLHLEVGAIFFEYRNVVKIATCFCGYNNYN